MTFYYLHYLLQKKSYSFCIKSHIYLYNSNKLDKPYLSHNHKFQTSDTYSDIILTMKSYLGGIGYSTRTGILYE